MFYLIIINVMALIICFIDKRRSICGKWRIKESTLLILGVIGGSFGLLLGMYLFHHKTKKLKFKLVYVFCLVWVYIIYFYLLKFKYLV